MPSAQIVAQNYSCRKRSGKAAYSPLRLTWDRTALQSLQQFRERCLQSRGDFAEGAQPRLPCATLQVRNMHLVDAGLLGKVNLPPIPGAAQLPDPLTRRRADVLCHVFIIGLAHALYLVHTLSGLERWPICCCTEILPSRFLSRSPYSRPVVAEVRALPAAGAVRPRSRLSRWHVRQARSIRIKRQPARRRSAGLEITVRRSPGLSAPRA